MLADFLLRDQHDTWIAMLPVRDGDEEAAVSLLCEMLESTNVSQNLRN